MTRSTKQDVNKVRAQVDTAFDNVRTPLLAALGAGNAASQAVIDSVHKARERVNEGPDGARKAIDEARQRVENLRPHGDVSDLRERLDPAEVRKLVEEYTEAARKLYERLADSGEETMDRILARRQVKDALDQLQEALENAQTRIEEATTDARDRVEDVLSRVTSRTKESGSHAAETAKQVVDGATESATSAAREATSQATSATSTTSTATKKATSKKSAASTGSKTTSTRSTAKSGTAAGTRKSTTKKSSTS